MRDLNLQNFYAWLLDGQIGHFDVETVEVDAVKTLVDCVRKFTFARSFDALLVVQCTALVEDTEEVVELNNGTGVNYEVFPVA